MIWWVFVTGGGCGMVVGVVLGKLLTEREMVDDIERVGEQKYYEGYTKGYQDAQQKWVP